MWTVQYRRFGGPEVLHVEEVSEPTPRRGQAVVRMIGSGVSRIDAVYRQGRFPHGWRFPKQTGFDGVGEVVRSECGVRPGTWVCTVLGLEPANARGTTVELCALEPQRLGLFPATYQPTPEDAGQILGSLTALRALRDGLRLLPRQRVLIVGAGGPVGVAAIQLASLLGARVDAVTGAAAMQICRELGAERVFDHRDPHTSTVMTARHYDSALIAAGRPATWVRAVRPGGRIAMSDATTLPLTLRPARQAKLTAVGIAAGHDPDDLTWIAHRIADGELRAVTGRRYAVNEIQRAHAELGSPGTNGARLVEH